jgi:hypothetical protein
MGALKAGDHILRNDSKMSASNCVPLTSSHSSPSSTSAPSPDGHHILHFLPTKKKKSIFTRERTFNLKLNSLKLKIEGKNLNVTINCTEDQIYVIRKISSISL